jgi:hypothetical protein
MRQFKNGKTRFDAADIDDAFSTNGTPTEGGTELLALIAGAPSPSRHPDEFQAWMEARGTRP